MQNVAKTVKNHDKSIKTEHKIEEKIKETEKKYDAAARNEQKLGSQIQVRSLSPAPIKLLSLIRVRCVF